MKNIFKLMGIALMSCSLMVACGDKDNESDDPTPTPTPTPVNPSWSANFMNEELSVSALANNSCGNTQNGFAWLYGFANVVNGQQVQFPYVSGFMTGDTKDAMEENGLELYKETYYEAGNNQYGDWQSHSKISFNVAALDMTTHTVSATIVNELYSLTDVMQYLSSAGITNESSDEEYEIAFDEGVASSRKGNITVNFSNLAFNVASK